MTYVGLGVDGGLLRVGACGVGDRLDVEAARGQRLRRDKVKHQAQRLGVQLAQPHEVNERVVEAQLTKEAQDGVAGLREVVELAPFVQVSHTVLEQPARQRRKVGEHLVGLRW